MTDARDVVTRRLVRRARRFPDLDLDPLDTHRLAGRDAALARAIDQTVARRWLTLQALIESRLTRPWPEVQSELQAAMLTGAAQIVFLDRVPAHAAINGAVEWAKDNVRPKAGGFVNAVLRKVAALCGDTLDSAPADPSARDVFPRADGRWTQLTEPVFAEDPVLRLAQQTSHGTALIEHWTNAFGKTRAAALCRHGLVRPPVIVVTDKVHPALLPHDEPGFAVFDPAASTDLVELLEALGARVQDPAAALPVRAASALPATLIVDACAGQGTKTRQLAATHPDATIVATDIDTRRREVLRAEFADDSRVEVVDPEQLASYNGRADLVLLDVPCSNTGVLPRRPEARYRFNAQSLTALVDLQRQIIADTLPLLTDDGHILYATCSLEPSENEQQIAWLTKWHPFEIVDQHTMRPTGAPGEATTGYRDGGFFAVAKRRPGT